jgi:hypothetical protein
MDGQLGGGIVLLFIIYFFKSNDKARNWLTRFLNSKNFEVELDETKEHPMVLIKGKLNSIDRIEVRVAPLCLGDLRLKQIVLKRG